MHKAVKWAVIGFAAIVAGAGAFTFISQQYVKTVEELEAAAPRLEIVIDDEGHLVNEHPARSEFDAISFPHTAGYAGYEVQRTYPVGVMLDTPDGSMQLPVTLKGHINARHAVILHNYLVDGGLIEPLTAGDHQDPLEHLVAIKVVKLMEAAIEVGTIPAPTAALIDGMGTLMLDEWELAEYADVDLPEAIEWNYTCFLAQTTITNMAEVAAGIKQALNLPNGYKPPVQITIPDSVPLKTDEPCGIKQDFLPPGPSLWGDPPQTPPDTELSGEVPAEPGN